MLDCIVLNIKQRSLFKVLVSIGFYRSRPLNRLFIACGSLKEDSTLSCRKKNSLKLDTKKDFHKLSFGNYFLSLAHSIFSIRFYLTGSTIIELRSFYRSDTVGLRYKAVFWVTPSFKKLKKAAPLGGFSFCLYSLLPEEGCRVREAGWWEQLLT